MRCSCAQKPFFSILKKVSAPITSGDCSRGCQLQSLFCVYDKLERDLFRSYKKALTCSPKLYNYYKTQRDMLGLGKSLANQPKKDYDEF